MKRTGIVEQSEQERALYKQLLCNCGTCPKEALSTCTCGRAHNARDQIREELAKGMTPDQIRDKYAAQHGEGCVIVQASSGKDAALWIIPSILALGGFGLIWHLSKKWRAAGRDDDEGDSDSQDEVDSERRDEYDDRIDAELRDLE